MMRMRLSLIVLVILVAFVACKRSEEVPGQEVPVPGEADALIDRLDLKTGDRAEIKAARKQARDDLIAMGSAAVPALVARMHDPSFTIRWEMVNILGYIKDHAATDPLMERVLNDDNPHVRWRAMWALTSVNDSSTAGKFKSYLEDEDAFAAWNAAVGLSMVDKDQAAIPYLKEGLKSGDSWVRWEAVDGLGHVWDETASKALAPMLEDPDTRVRHETVMSLGSIADDEATRLLLQALNAEDKEIRWRAAMHLGKIGGPGVKGALEKRLAVEKDEDVRKYIEKALD